METIRPPFQKYIFVCENEREAGVCCGQAGSQLREKLKQRVKDLGLSKKIRVSRTGCLDACADGPNILLMPDHIWFKHVAEGDLEEIIRVAQSR